MIRFKAAVVKWDVTMSASFGSPKRPSSQGNHAFKDLKPTEVTRGPVYTPGTIIIFDVNPSVSCYKLVISPDNNIVVLYRDAFYQRFH